MQGSAFKTILEQPEATGDPMSGWNPVDNLNQFEAMSASVFTSANSKTAGNGNLWTAAMSAYADNDNDDDDVEDSMPVISQTEPPSTLAQLREKLGHDLSIGELCSLRRKFAFEHHPDRLAPTERNQATSRLATANDLIDLAIQNIGHKSAAG
ncbi:MAG: hypothetical protein GY761_17925 [Hyphomicrobiales bacterium]|nr:hypothetical protein [Hyphomicrobiales bacterium]